MTLRIDENSGAFIDNTCTAINLFNRPRIIFSEATCGNQYHFLECLNMMEMELFHGIKESQIDAEWTTKVIHDENNNVERIDNIFTIRLKDTDEYDSLIKIIIPTAS